jgi:glycosyltransferase involved in cell wall biosynthesis
MKRRTGQSSRFCQEWADEIIIVDGESTDETLKIASAYDAKIIKTTTKPLSH